MDRYENEMNNERRSNKNPVEKLFMAKIQQSNKWLKFNERVQKNKKEK